MIDRLCRSALVGLGVLLACLSGQAHAQNPKTITMVVPYAAGGGTDTVARLIGERMSRTLGQTIIVENVVGGGSTLANDRVARSAPDGSTVLINHVGLLAAPSLFTNLRYDTKTAFEAVGLVNNAPMVLIGRKSIPGEGPKDYVAWIKGQRDKANFAHGGIGTNSHLCAVMMGNVLGFKPTIVAYRGSAPAIGDLLAGQIDLLWDQVTNALPQIQAGMLHGIAITSPQRLEQLKDVPTTAELGMPEVSYSMWHGLYVAKGTPRGAGRAGASGKAEATRHPAVPCQRIDARGARAPVRRRSPARGDADRKFGDQSDRGEVSGQGFSHSRACILRDACFASSSG
jgi:tripartite-type tricarboxylate transporter receptor subunit TctC